MTSITRKLHRLLVRRELACCLAADFVGALFLPVAVLLLREYWFLGKISLGGRRFFTWDHTAESIVYHVVDGNEKELLTYPVYHALCLIGAVLAALLVLQLLGLIFSGASKQRKIRKILQPINELALRADELNRMTFDEDKYQRIEDAITHIQPEETKMLSLGDSDLQGIEAAMNNLLLRMRDSYRQQARFVNDASHELRTPIAVIGGYANMLARWGKTDEKVLDESIAAIQHESEHMGYLVEQLLFLARGDSGKTVLQLEMFDLGAMMREIYEESVMVDEDHHYQFLDSGKPLQVKADAALLKQAVRILVDNAAKYTRDGDEIILSYGKTEDDLPFLLVQDTGIGMAEADVAHMFERFYRADDVRGQEGTGLGLSIAKWIVDKHGGHFEVLSRTELGTRIRIVLS
jgi:signal transduction histidine kinase